MVRHVTELTNNLSGLAQSYKIQSLDDIFKFVADIPGLGESTQNLNTGSVTNMIEQAMGGMSGLAGFGGGAGAGGGGEGKNGVGRGSGQPSSAVPSQNQGLPQLSGVMAAFGQMMRDSNGNARKI